MSRIIQFKRFSAAAIANTIGANGEIIFDITNKGLTVHDGVTAGGFAGLTDVTARGLANAASIRANSANVLAQASFDKANSANVLAQSSYNWANTINVSAQAAFSKANVSNTTAEAAFTKSNVANTTAEAGFAKANAANILAQAAFTQANTSAQTVPQNAQTTNYILQLSDAGKHIYYTQNTNVILYIPTTSNVSFSNGTTIMIVSKTTSNANVTVSPNTEVSMFLAGNTTSASRNVTTYGMATLIQVAANTWFISGSGVV
jgi:hypothetical protein